MIGPLSILHVLGHAAFRLLGARTRFLQAGRRRVALHDLPGTGSGPPLVLVHGLGANATSFLTLARSSAKISSRVLVPDLPGHGRSSFRKGDPPLQILELGEAIDAVLAYAGAPAVIVGNSLGGALGLHALVERPDRVRGWVGLAPAGAPLTAEERAGVRNHFSGGLRNAHELQLRLWHRMPASVYLVLPEFARYWKLPEVEQMVGEIVSADIGLATSTLRERRGRALVLWGESDRLLPASSVSFFREHLGHDAVEVVPRCGHLPQMERPRLVAARIAQFIAALPQAGRSL